MKSMKSVETYQKKTFINSKRFNIMAEYSLTLGERLAAKGLFDSFKGSTTALAAVIDDVKAILITQAEWDTANLVKTPTDEEIKKLREAGNNENIQQAFQWKEEGSEKVVALSQEGASYLTGKIKEKNDAGEFGFADVAVISLSEKLK